MCSASQHANGPSHKPVCRLPSDALAGRVPNDVAPQGMRGPRGWLALGALLLCGGAFRCPAAAGVPAVGPQWCPVGVVARDWLRQCF